MSVAIQGNLAPRRIVREQENSAHESNPKTPIDMHCKARKLLPNLGSCLLAIGLIAALPRPTLRAVGPTLDKEADGKPLDAKPLDFARDVLPILSDKCFVCHGPDTKKKRFLRLDSYAAATKDRRGTRAIDPENLAESELLLRIRDSDDPMPPEDAEKQLTDHERDLLERWVLRGGEYSKHWAFVRPEKANPPRFEGLELGPIDAFVERRLRERGVETAPAADRATLARRAALVLTGLPPEPEQLERFLADTTEEAWERLVDELLASPRFGEHQARYWLDAIRYGDTHGLHLDNKRGIYPFRDWVVRAFNQNQALDEFLTWQLAGDLLPNPQLEQRVATGFVRMNPTTSEGGALPEEFQAKNNFDRVETLGTVLLGMTLTCARCHTHKYDPIPQTEYYRLMAFFNSTAEKSMDGNAYVYGPSVKAPADGPAWDEWTRLREERVELLNEIDTALAQKNLTTADRQTWSEADAAKRLELVGDEKSAFSLADLAPKASELARRMKEAKDRFTTSLVARDLPKPRPTHVLHRGEYNQPQGDPVEPGILEVMGIFPEGAPRNRLGLARWLTSRDHPLVTRVLVNRIWQRVFGDGLVRTPEDFGLQGRQPTHPELLDWLAVELHDSGWNLKSLLRRMLLTRTFRQSSARREGIEDPENLLLARGPSYRLDAEVIRDVGLWASGLLDPRMGGEGVKPYQPSGLWSALAHPASNTKKYERDKGRKIYRRSLYVYWKRTSPHPMMTLFDAPSRESSCVRRSRTNTSLQSLGLLNETQRLEMGRALAERLLTKHDKDAARLDRLFELLACRKPSDAERAACDRLLHTLRERYSKNEKDALALLSVGDAPRREDLEASDHAAWTQLAVTVLASDLALLLY